MFWMRKPIVIKISSVICMSNNEYRGQRSEVRGQTIKARNFSLLYVFYFLTSVL
jgi:hypothetical protein